MFETGEDQNQTADKEEPALQTMSIDDQLRAVFKSTLSEPVPAKIQEMLRRISTGERVG